MLVLGAKPQALSDQTVPFAMSKDDLRTYRVLLAESDDSRDTVDHDVKVAAEK